MSTPHQHTQTQILTSCHCCRCGHTWTPATSSMKPEQCAKCKSRNWDKPKVTGRGRNFHA